MTLRAESASFSRRPRSWLAAGSVVAALAGWAGDANAHPPPEAEDIAWYGSGGAETVVVKTNRGFLVDPGTGTFIFLCRQALDLADGERAPMAMASDGSLLVASETDAIMRGVGDYCDWFPASDPLTGRKGFDLTASPVPGTFYLITADQTRTDNFFRSVDDGVTWEALGTDDVPYTRVLVAPSDGQRVYRSGSGLDPTTGRYTVIATSSDGGTTWTENTLAIVEGVLLHELIAVHPTDPDRLFLRAEASTTGIPEHLLLSTDAGATFTEVLSAPDLKAVAVAPAGDTVYAGAGNGLYRSDDGGQTFARVDSAGLERIACLSFHGSELYACANQDNELGVSVSSDGGQSFTRYLRFPDVTQRLECASAQRAGPLCDGWFAEWDREVIQGNYGGATATPPATGGAAGSGGTPAVGGAPSLATADSGFPTAAGGAGALGGEGTPADSSSAGCSCRVGSSSTGTAWGTAAALLLGAALTRRRNP